MLKVIITVLHNLHLHSKLFSKESYKSFCSKVKHIGSTIRLLYVHQFPFCNTLSARSSGTHSRLMIQLWYVYQMSLWAAVKQSICSFVAFYEVDFHFMDSFENAGL